MIRYLTERLPVMITPRWVDTRCQPIGVRAVLDYLIEALETPDARGVYEIGGPDVLTYREMMLGYARVRGLHRLIVAFPVPHPEWSSHFVDLITPIPYAIASTLVESLQTEVVVRDDRALREFSVRPLGYLESVELALTRVASDEVETTWASSLASLGTDVPIERKFAVHEGMRLDQTRTHIRASPAEVFDVICALGGDEGWPAGNALWQLRGLIDRLVGGVGMRRGRRHPHELSVGEPLDFWRVEALEPPHLLRLRAEMKLPGTAWLQFEVLPDEHGARVEQTAFFEPRGLPGYLYWYAVLPFHRFIFPGLLPEFVVAAPQVLDERVAGDDHAGGAVAFQPAHRSKPGLEAAVVGFDPVVGVLLGVVEAAGEQLLDRSGQGRGPVGGDLGRFAVGDGRREEPCRRGVSRFLETYTSMTWPYWSTARYT